MHQNRQRAAELIAETHFGVSMQVAQEFYQNARIKARLAITSAQAETIISLLLARPMVTTDADLFAKARSLSREMAGLKACAVDSPPAWCSMMACR